MEFQLDHLARSVSFVLCNGCCHELIHRNGNKTPLNSFHRHLLFSLLQQISLKNIQGVARNTRGEERGQQDAVNLEEAQVPERGLSTVSFPLLASCFCSDNPLVLLFLDNLIYFKKVPRDHELLATHRLSIGTSRRGAGDAEGLVQLRRLLLHAVDVVVEAALCLLLQTLPPPPFNLGVAGLVAQLAEGPLRVEKDLPARLLSFFSSVHSTLGRGCDAPRVAAPSARGPSPPNASKFS